MHITIRKPGFSFTNVMVNVSHLVHHLSFGERSPFVNKHECQPRITLFVRSTGHYDARYLPDEIKKSVSPLDRKMYVTHENVTQEHYLKETFVSIHIPIAHS